MICKVITLGVLFTGCLLDIAQAENPSRNYDKDAVVIEQPNVSTGLKHKTTQSGYCCTLMDINTMGDVENVRVNYCTHDVLAGSVKFRVEKFRFIPAMLDDKPVFRKDKRYNQSYFRFDDNSTMPIPGPNGYLDPNDDPKVEIPPRPESIADRILWVEKYFNNKMTCSQPIA